METFGSGTVSATFYAPGEIGGAFGYVENFATISNCHVNNTTIHAFGQDNKKVMYGLYTVYGKHVGQFIGDIRTSGDEKDTIVMTNCTVNNTTCENRWDKHSKCNMIGQVYILSVLDTKGSVTIDGKSIF